MSVEVFAGFVSPTKNFFHLPNNWTDIIAEIDNLAELKVVTYIARHTWGYHEYGIAKTISVDEFMHGRRRHDGSRMDKGTGLSNHSVIDGLKAAIKHGYLVCEIDTSDLARVKKSYALKMSAPPEDSSPPEESSPGAESTASYEESSSRGAESSPSYEDSAHRSEKETLERNQRKTLKKEREIPDASVSPKPASLSLSSQKHLTKRSQPTSFIPFTSSCCWMMRSIPRRSRSCSPRKRSRVRWRINDEVSLRRRSS